MTAAERLAALAAMPATAAERDRLRTCTATNLAAAAGDLGHVTSFLGSLPAADTPGDRAYRHGVVLHARTQDDFFPAGRSHVGAVVTAAVLALGATVRTNPFDALGAGYRVLCAVAGEYAPDAQRRGLRPTGVFGPLGAAAAAAVALGHDEAAVADAIAIAAALAGGTNQAWTAGSDEWALQAGTAARVGVEAAQLAGTGFRAAHDALEGATGWSATFFADPGAGRLDAALDRGTPAIDAVAIKPYPVSGIAQVPTALACEAHARLDGQRIDEAVLAMSPAEAAYPGSLGTDPRSRPAALMSVAFCVAAGLAEGRVLLAQLEDPAAARGARVAVVPSDELAETTARLRVRAGTTELTLDGRGDDILYPSWAGTAQAAAELATRSEAPPAIVQALIHDLEGDDPDIVRLAAAVERRP